MKPAKPTAKPTSKPASKRVSARAQSRTDKAVEPAGAATTATPKPASATPAARPSQVEGQSTGAPTRTPNATPRESRPRRAPTRVRYRAEVQPLVDVGRQILGIHNLRPGQEEALAHIVGKRDVLAVMPTGSGKSLLYQLPSLVLPGITVVVSPLIALIKDQIDKMRERDVPVCRFDSTLTTKSLREAEALVRADGGKLVLTTPERMSDPAFRSFLREGAGGVGVSLFVVDEAHCVSQWGHDFRPAYLTLRRALEELDRPPVLATTATAPPHVRDDILHQLDIPDAAIVTTTFERPNLHFEVIAQPGDDDKIKTLVTLLRKLPKPGIVYCATVKKVEELHEKLARHQITVSRYHGRLSKKERTEEQHRFMEQRDLIMIATNAFGLGVDKANIRYVLHYHVPGSVEAYAQEAGRGGRDGKPARCVLLFSPDDVAIQEYFLKGTYPTRRQVRGVYSALEAWSEDEPAPPTLANLALSSRVGAQRTRTVLSLLKDEGFVVERKDHTFWLAEDRPDEATLIERAKQYEARRIADRQRLDALLEYVRWPDCRNQFILSYLGEPDTPVCGRCDNCLRSRDQALAASDRAEQLEESVTRELLREFGTEAEAKRRRTIRHRVIRIDEPRPDPKHAAGANGAAGAAKPSAGAADATKSRAGATANKPAGKPTSKPKPSAGAAAQTPAANRPGPVQRRAARGAPGDRGARTTDATRAGDAPVPDARLADGRAVRSRSARSRSSESQMVLPLPAGANRAGAARDEDASTASDAARADAERAELQALIAEQRADALGAASGAKRASRADAADEDRKAPIATTSVDARAPVTPVTPDTDDVTGDARLDARDDAVADLADRGGVPAGELDGEYDDDEYEEYDEDEDEYDDEDDEDEDGEYEDDEYEDDEYEYEDDDDEIEAIEKTAAALAEEGYQSEDAEITILARKRVARPPRKKRLTTRESEPRVRRRRRRRRRKRGATIPPKSAFTSPVLSQESEPPRVVRSGSRSSGPGPVIEYVRGPMRINMTPVASATPNDVAPSRKKRRVRGGAASWDRPGDDAYESPAAARKRRRRRRKRRREAAAAERAGPVAVFSVERSRSGSGSGSAPTPPPPPTTTTTRPEAAQPAEPTPGRRKKRRRRRRGRGGRGAGNSNGNGKPATQSAAPERSGGGASESSGDGARDTTSDRDRGTPPTGTPKSSDSPSAS